MDIKSFEPLFGNWYTDAVIGVGSFGKVYRAYRDSDGRRYYSAIKHISLPADEEELYELRSEGRDDRSISSYYAELVKDIGEETRLLSELRGSPNIVNYEESSVIPKANGIGYDIFIRMELLESLSKRMARESMTYEKTLDLGIDILNALEFCEKKGIIHRDIKPDNIFVDPNGKYKLGDFGIARSLEKTSTLTIRKGTYNYMAPEVYKGEKYGAACDIYSLGLVLYRLMNKGRLPFVPGTEAAVTHADRETALKRRLAGEKLPAPCDANQIFAGIISRACAFDPADRYSSPAEMRRYLENLKNLKEIPAGVAAGRDGGTARLDNNRRIRPDYAGRTTAGAAPAGANSGAVPDWFGEEEEIEKESKTGRVIGIIAAVLAAALVIAAAAFLPKLMKEKLVDDRSSCKKTLDYPTAAPGGAGGVTPMPEITATPSPMPYITTAPTSTPMPSPESYVDPLDEPILFTSSVIRDAAKSAAGVSGTMTGRDALKVKTLSLAGKGLSDISDLRYFTNLETLNLNNNSIEDLSPLEGLTNLKKLQICNNRIWDISPLKYLTRLEYLTAYQNNISDIGALRYMRELNYLSIYENYIEDIEPLRYLTKLTKIGLGTNHVTDLSPLSGLYNLTELHLKNNGITDISPLRNLTNLVSLSLYNSGSPVFRNDIADLTPLYGMTKLELLKLQGNARLTRDQIEALWSRLPQCKIQSDFT